MSPIFFICKNCGVRIEADEDFSGGTVSCPKCKAELEVPLKGLAKGLEIGGFVLQERLGAGGMGEVWLARQTSLERDVALKILSPKLCKDNDFINRFLKEAKTSAKLTHPNIVSAYNGGHDKGFYYLAVQYVNGIELGIRLKLEGILEEKEALHIARGIAEGLCYAWNKHKILHRDIKPQNMIVDKGGIPKLMDMGISKSLTDDVSLTLTGFVVGTPAYMSPEQARAEKDIDCRSDIYSLGATLYHFVTGQLPYEGKTTMAIISRQAANPFPPPREKNPEVSVQCAALLEIMMAKNPEGRQQSWEEVIRDIDLVMSKKMPQAWSEKQNVVSVLSRIFMEKTKSSGIFDSIRKMNRKLIYALGTAILVITVLFILLFAIKKGKSRHEAKVAKNDDAVNVVNDRKKEEPVPVDKIKAFEKKEKKEQAHVKAPVQAIKDPEQLRNALIRLNPGLTADKCTIKDENGRWSININSPSVTDISPLAGMPVKGLSLFGTNVTDISTLKGLQINYINLSGLKISDFSPLKGMPLDTVCLVNSPIKDLSVLDNKNLHNLMIIDAPVEDLSPLAGMKLTKLWLTSTKVSDLEPLKGLDLHELAIDNTQVKDLSPLKGIPLETLVFTPRNFGQKDISMLRNEMKTIKFIGVTLGDVGMQHKQTAEEFWAKFHQENMRRNALQHPGR